MKSDRHEARMALSCSALGFCDAGAVEAAADAAGLDSREASDRRTAGAIDAGAGELSTTGAVPAGEEEDEDDADEDAGEDAGEDEDAGDDSASDCTVF
jgi:hypothetical protein